MKQGRFAIIAFLLMMCAAGAQANALFSINGIRPNILLAVLIVLAFFIENPFLYFGLIVCASLAVRFGPGIGPEVAALAVICAVLFLVRERLVWPGVWGCAALTLVGVVGLYLILDPGFMYYHPMTVFFEVAYTMGIGIVLFEGIDFYVKKTRSTI